MRSIKINGTDYPTLARYSAIRLFCQKAGIDFFEFDSRILSHKVGTKEFKPSSEFLDDMTLLLYCFIEKGLEAQNQPMTLTIDDVFDFLVQDMGQVKLVIELVTEIWGQTKEQKKTKVSQK